MRIDLIGKKYGSLTVVSFAHLGKFGNARWCCVCDCGNKMVLDSHTIKRKESKNCHRCITRSFADETLSSKNRLYLVYRTSAKDRKVSFSLNFEYFVQLVTKNCAYCGSPSLRYFKTKDSRKGFYCNGLDRVDNNKGYDFDNVVPCCSDCNYAKGSLTKEDFIAWLNKCYNHLKLNEFNEL